MKFFNRKCQDKCLTKVLNSVESETFIIAFSINEIRGSFIMNSVRVKSANQIQGHSL